MSILKIIFLCLCWICNITAITLSSIAIKNKKPNYLATLIAVIGMLFAFLSFLV